MPIAIRNFSLRTHLLLLVGIPLLVLLLLETVVSYLVGLHTANQVFDRWLLDSAHSIGQEVRLDGDTLRFIAAADAVDMFEWDDIDDTYFRIIDPAGKVIAGDLPLVLPFALDRLREGPVFENVRIDGEPGRAVSILSNPGAADEIVVQVAETLNKRRGMTNEVLSLVAMKKSLLLTAAMIAITVAVNRGFAPLRRLSRELARRSPRELTPIPTDDAPLEVRGLIENTNGLLGRIEHMLNAHEAFIGNIAHQVRTPLAGIKLQCQLALRETDSDDVRHALEHIASAADHMTHVNSQLLKLARAEIAFDRGPRAAPTDLVALVHACCEEFEPGARAQGITLVASAPEARLDVEGDPALLYEMLRNLVENAIVYGRPRGHVWVTAEQAAGAVRVAVADDGPGIPPEHRPQIFDHFYRPPNSPGEGCGLGLPIVREIARAHGTDVRLEDRGDEPGTRFVVEFPSGPRERADA
ncbi:MAG: sensor histidine kinase [Gammaproteobacteria bacterium]|nr:sensor histidine kinase [Gammaproteobacteria bacterium]MCP5201865.1 sensor histidine kinase [Gammaproteobacteria bacterium]